MHKNILIIGLKKKLEYFHFFHSKMAAKYTKIDRVDSLDAVFQKKFHLFKISGPSCSKLR